MLQTNNTGMCLQYLSHTGPVSSHSTHSSGSRLLCWEPSEASPGLHAPPSSKSLRLRHSVGPQRCRLDWACVLCPSQVRVARVFGERGRCDLSPLPSPLLSFLGVPLAPLLRRMVTVQLAKEPACSLVVNVSLGLPPSSPGCLAPEGDGLQLAISIPSFVLCAVLMVSYVRAFRMVAIPQSGLLVQVSSLWLCAGCSGLILESTAAHASSASLPSRHLLVVDAGICTASLLGELPLGS